VPGLAMTECYNYILCPIQVTQRNHARKLAKQPEPYLVSCIFGSGRGEGRGRGEREGGDEEGVGGRGQVGSGREGTGLLLPSSLPSPPLLSISPSCSLPSFQPPSLPFPPPPSPSLPYTVVSRKRAHGRCTLL